MKKTDLPIFWNLKGWVPCLLNLLLSINLNLSLSGCTVKEDREQCPCLLSFNLERLENRDGSLQIFLKNGDGFFFTDSIPASQACYDVQVPKGSLDLLAVSPTGVYLPDGTSMDIDEGDDCPPIFLEAESLDICTDHVIDTLDLYKNHCRLSVRFVFDAALENTYPAILKELEMVIRGKVAGYDERGLPFAGTFSYPLRPDEQGHCEVVLPRQLDDSILLEIGKDGKVYQTFAVGEYMVEAGYDWRQKSLKDCSMTVDIAFFAFHFQINAWQKTIKTQIII